MAIFRDMNAIRPANTEVSTDVRAARAERPHKQKTAAMETAAIGEFIKNPFLKTLIETL
jgi:hypothetical protein